jgi:hypothetical protein
MEQDCQKQYQELRQKIVLLSQLQSARNEVVQAELNPQQQLL